MNFKKNWLILLVAQASAFCLLASSNAHAGYYTKSERVVAADFTEDDKKIVFVKYVKIDWYSFLYDPHVFVFGGSRRTVSEKSYLYVMNRDGWKEKRILELPPGDFQYRFWNGKKLAVSYYIHHKRDLPQGGDDIDTEHKICIYDIDKNQNVDFPGKSTNNSINELFNSMIINMLWSLDGKSIHVLKDGDTVWKIDLDRVTAEKGTMADWSNSFNWSPRLYLENPDRHSVAAKLAKELIPDTQNTTPFFKPFWWGK